jgi:hypothetical protein
MPADSKRVFLDQGGRLLQKLEGGWPCECGALFHEKEGATRRLCSKLRGIFKANILHLQAALGLAQLLAKIMGGRLQE